jgi:hypothetical protein
MEGRPEASQCRLSAQGGRGQPADPMLGLGNRKARTGRPATRHLPQPACVLHCEHGKRPRKAQARGKEGRETPTKRRCPWQWRTGRRSPQTGKPATRGGRGVKAPPNGEGPSLSETADAQGAKQQEKTGGCGRNAEETASMGHRGPHQTLWGPLEPARQRRRAARGPSRCQHQPGTRNGRH